MVSLSVHTCTVSSIQLTPQHGQPLSAHLHRELNSTYSSTCDNCMSESSRKMQIYLAQLLRCFPSFCVDVVTVKKNMKRVIRDKTLIVKSRQGQVCYLLKSVVVHLGESSSSGHYISYTCDKYGEMVYNDSDAHRVLWNSIKENISTG